MTRYVIIGNSAAGVFAADAIRKTDPQGEIILLSTEKEDAYSRCMTTYYVSGSTDPERMKIRPAGYYEKNRIDFRRGVTVTGILPEVCVVETDDGMKIQYDKLLIASGSSAKQIVVDGADPGEIFTMRTMADANRILAMLKAGKNRVAVLGGGLVSLKTAGALAEHGAEVSVIVTSQNILSQQFDKTGGDLIMHRMAKNGVHFLLGASAKKVLHDAVGACCGVELTTGETIPCDFVFAGKGVAPNSGFLPPEIQCEDGFVLVDKEMHTNLPSIYAAGDVAKTFDKLSGKPAVYAIWPNATEQGEIAGYNMAGVPRDYEGAVSMNSLHFFGLNAICGGDGRGRTEGAKSAYRCDPNREIYQKCVFSNGVLIGFILVGKTANAGILMAQLGKEISFEQCLTLLESGAIAVL